MIRDDLNLGKRSELLRIRCPKCFKLYSVDSTELNEAKPKFECLDCSQRFWIPFPEALEQASGLIGFPMEWIEEQKEAQVAPETVVNPEPEVEQKPFSCPSCSEPYAGGEKECKSCGIIFDKFKDPKERREEPFASRDLKELWEKVVHSYDDFSEHEKFIMAAQTEAALPYANFKYKQVLEVNPADEFALKCGHMIEALMLATVERHIPVQEESAEEKKSAFPKLRIGTFIILLCGIVIAMGVLIPGARNLVGLGSAALFFVLALRYYFRVL